MSPFLIGVRRGLWRANVIGLPYVMATAVYKGFYWLAAECGALLLLVICTWRPATRVKEKQRAV